MYVFPHTPVTLTLTAPEPSLGNANPRVWYTSISCCFVSESSMSRCAATLAMPRYNLAYARLGDSESVRVLRWWSYIEENLLYTKAGPATLTKANHVFIQIDAFLCGLDPTFGVKDVRVWEHRGIVVYQVGRLADWSLTHVKANGQYIPKKQLTPGGMVYPLYCRASSAEILGIRTTRPYESRRASWTTPLCRPC